MNTDTGLWVEKYRPRKVDDMILPEKYKEDFLRMIERQELVNLLFYGPPGSGKTTLARILCSKSGIVHNGRDNLLKANGSAQKTRSIKYIENVIKPFLKNPPAGGDKYRVVFIDEADGFSADAYSSLRSLMEEFYEREGRFVFTCNYISKVPSAIQSRFTPYVFKQVPKEFLMKYLSDILTQEEIKFEEKSIKFVIDGFYPDVRRMVNTIQKSSWSGTLDVNIDDITTTEKLIIASIVEVVKATLEGKSSIIGHEIANMIDLLEKGDVEYRGLYSQLFYGKLPASVKVIANKYGNSHQNCLVPHMHFMGMVYEIILALKEYKRVTGK